MTYTLIITSSSGLFLTPVATKEDGEKIKKKLIKHIEYKKDPIFEFEYNGDFAAIVVDKVASVYVQSDEKMRQYLFNQRRDLMFMENNIQNEINNEYIDIEYVKTFYKQEVELVSMLYTKLERCVKAIQEHTMEEETKQNLTCKLNLIINS